MLSAIPDMQLLHSCVWEIIKIVQYLEKQEQTHIHITKLNCRHVLFSMTKIFIIT